MIFRHHFGGFICIQIHERIAQSAELLLDSAGHLNNVVVEFFELSVKALHRMCLVSIWLSSQLVEFLVKLP